MHCAILLREMHLEFRDPHPRSGRILNVRICTFLVILESMQIVYFSWWFWIKKSPCLIIFFFIHKKNLIIYRIWTKKISVIFEMRTRVVDPNNWFIDCLLVHHTSQFLDLRSTKITFCWNVKKDAKKPVYSKNMAKFWSIFR